MNLEHPAAWFVFSRAELPTVIHSEADATRLHARAEEFSTTTKKLQDLTHEDLVFLQGLFLVPEIEDLRILLRGWFNQTPQQDEDFPHRCPSEITSDFMKFTEKWLRAFVGNLLLKQYGLWVVYHGRRSTMTRPQKRLVRKVTIIRLAHAKKSFIRLNNLMLKNRNLPMQFRQSLLSIGRRLLPIQTAIGPVPEHVHTRSKTWSGKLEAKRLRHEQDPWRGLPLQDNLVPFPTQDRSEETGESQ